MKHGHALAIGLAALALAACGGSGSNNSSTSPVTTNSDYRVEAVQTNTTNVAARDLNGGYLYPDPLNLQVGQSVTFQLVSYSGSAQTLTRNVVDSGVTFTSTGPTATGQVSTTDGTFSALRDTNGTDYVTTARYQGAVYTTDYAINPVQVLLRGRVRDASTGGPVFNAEVDFYAPQNLDDASSPVALIGTTHTAYNGSFIVSLPTPTTAVTTVDQANAASKITFTVSSAHLPTGYSPSFIYRGSTYAAGSTLVENRPVLLSQNLATDVTTGETAYLPFATGDRYLVDSDSDTLGTTDIPTLTNDGTILLTPASSVSASRKSR